MQKIIYLQLYKNKKIFKKNLILNGGKEVYIKDIAFLKKN